MSNEYAPQSLHDLYDRVAVPSKQMSGIVGDSAHTYGYHRGRNYVSHGDYSAVLAADLGGDGSAACALDIKLSAADMVTVTNRLMTAMRGGDPRTAPIREFFGTQDGRKVTGWDRHNPAVGGDDSFTTSDDSHLWHIHLSIYRSMVGNSALVGQVADVINGSPHAPVGAPKKAPAPPTPVTGPAWPFWMPPGQYFGLITGPAASHGGANPQEREAVFTIQHRLQMLGFAPRTAGWADGKFESATAAAVAQWQRQRMPGTTRFGEVWPDDWRKLVG